MSSSSSPPNIIKDNTNNSKTNKRKRDINDNSDIYKDAHTPIIRRKIKKRRKNISKVIKDLVLERQGVRCNICNILWNSCFELDHIIPYSICGSDEQDNLQFLCNSCHKYKTYKIDEITRQKIKIKKRISKSRIVSSHRKKYIELMGSNIQKKREDIKYNMINSIYGIINDLKETSKKDNNLNNLKNIDNNINNTIDLSQNNNLYNNQCNIDNIENKDFDNDSVYNNHLENRINTDRQLDNILGKINIIIENYNNFNSRRDQSNTQNRQVNNNILNKIKSWLTSTLFRF